MNFTLLVDLDDTLLSNPLESFMPAYLKGLSKALAPKVDPQKMVPLLLSATDKMIAKDNFDGTLENEFDLNFYPALGVAKADIHPLIETFYLGDYQSLRELTSPREDAVALVQAALSKGYDLVVATNPIFPRIAITSRLCWADLSPEIYPFALVTSYEDFHFAKPNPAYYSEILSYIGKPSQPAGMIGNSMKEDILPALAAGIPAFLVINNGIQSDKLPDGCQCGTLKDAVTWAQELSNKL
jgi:FMN phosphatase YigB (HAD superfamily)